MVVSSLFTGPSPIVVAVVFVLALAAAATVFWLFRGLLVDSRSEDRSAEFAGTSGSPRDQIAEAGAGAVEI